MTYYRDQPNDDIKDSEYFKFNIKTTKEIRDK